MKKRAPNRTDFEPTDRKASNDDLLARIKDLIAAEGWGPGERIPSERALAAQLGVTRASVHHALHTLTVMGVLETRQGSGTRISAHGANLFREGFDFLVLLNRPGYDTLQEAREMLEVQLAGLAALRRTDGDLAEIEAACSARRESGIDPDGVANTRFHAAVARAAHNPVLESLLLCLLEARAMQVRQEFYDAGVEPDWVVCDEIHERLVTAIREGDAAAARQAMQQDMIQARQVGEHYRALIAANPSAAVPAPE